MFESYSRIHYLDTSDEPGSLLLSPNEANELIDCCFDNINLLLLSPEIFDFKDTNNQFNLTKENPLNMKDSQNPFYNELYSCLLEEYNVRYLINAYLKSLASRDPEDQESIYGSIFKRILFDFNRKP